jgi:hypothetical protein
MKAEDSQHLGAKAAIDLERESLIAEIQIKIEKLFQNRETINPLIIEEKLVFHLDVLNFLVNRYSLSFKIETINNLYARKKLENNLLLIREKKMKQEDKADYLWQVSRSPAHWGILLSSFIQEALANIYS